MTAYVPNPDLDHALVYLEAKLLDSPTWVGVCGPVGVGKTLFLRLLMRRLGDRFTGIHIPRGFPEPAALERWILSQLGDRTEPFEAVARSLAERGQPLLLMIDEAATATADTLAWLERTSATLQARAVLAWAQTPGEATPAVLAACPARVFLEPLELASIHDYVASHLDRSQADESIREVFDARRLDAIALASAGNPRAIQRLADAELITFSVRRRRSAVRDSSRAHPELPPSAPVRRRWASVAAACTVALLAACAWLALRR